MFDYMIVYSEGEDMPCKYGYVAAATRTQAIWNFARSIWLERSQLPDIRIIKVVDL